MANETIAADVVVLGAGPAGYPCAIRLAQLGKKVTVIERGEIGGVCLNVGCIPSKALIYAGTLYEKMSHSAEMGIEVKGARVDLPKLIDWKASVVKKLTGGVAQLLKANGCVTLQGDAKFSGARSLEVTTPQGVKTVTFNQCVIATGSRPSALPGFEIDQKRIVDSTGALALKEVPAKMLCIGGGYIGLELGTFFSKIGSAVTVVEAFPNLLGGVDAELTRVVQKRLEKRGVKVLLNTKVSGAKVGKNGVDVKVGDKTESFDAVLVTVGRVPNTDGLALSNAGLKTDEKGFLLVDATRQTSIPGIYAIGDVAGQPLLAHKGTKEGLVAAEAIAGKRVAYDVVAIPAVIFTDPEIATVGMTEAEARQKGITPSVGVFPFVANGRALSMSEGEGFVKLVGDSRTGRLLGAQIVGPEASNLIAEATLALELGAMVEDLALTVHAHPTLPETLMEAAETALGHPIHIFQRKATPAPEVRA
jgi:dihydrolipoamide dehydrogenase